MDQLENISPNVYDKSKERAKSVSDFDENVCDDIDAREIFDILRNVNDPEHPLTLEQLHVIEEDNITVDNQTNSIRVFFTPTIPHCSMATLIGLSIRVLLLRVLPARYKVQVEITPGSHTSEHAVNKQLADKERVAAALENSNLIQVIEQCIDVSDSIHQVDADLKGIPVARRTITKEFVDAVYECTLGHLDDEVDESAVNYVIELRKKEIAV